MMSDAKQERLALIDQLLDSIQIPLPVVTPVETRVNCGNTELRIVEHGGQGNRAWAVWRHGTTVYGGEVSGPDVKSYDQCMAAARTLVVGFERGARLRKLIEDALKDGVTPVN